jgi:hypothetical protein
MIDLEAIRQRWAPTTSFVEIERTDDDYGDIEYRLRGEYRKDPYAAGPDDHRVTCTSKHDAEAFLRAKHDVATLLSIVDALRMQGAA